MTEVWSAILERINKTSYYLQKETMILDIATDLLTSLDDFILNLRNQFDYFESVAKDKNPECDSKDLSQRSKGRNTRYVFFYGSAASVQLNGRESRNICPHNCYPERTLETTIEFVKRYKRSVWFLFSSEISELRGIGTTLQKIC